MKPLLLLLLLFPLAWPWIAKYIWHRTLNWYEMAANILVSVTLVSAIYVIGKAGKTWDTEIWNGQITSKHRDHGHYVRSYSCYCTTDDKGHQTCQTCYEDRYTVNWYLKSTIGSIGIDSADWASRAVYLLPDPGSYTNAYVGEPCSKESIYTNYIKAVPESLFNLKSGTTSKNITLPIPAYPRVRNYYKVDRIFTVGLNISNREEWNKLLSEKLKTLGPKKEVNVIIILVNTSNISYRHALEETWLGGKKNDVVVFLGVTNYPYILWTDVMTFGANAGNALFVAELKDDLSKLPSLEKPELVIDSIAQNVHNRFIRKSMTDYQYLKDEIVPPTWILMLAGLLGIGSSVGLSIVFRDNAYFE